MIGIGIEIEIVFVTGIGFGTGTGIGSGAGFGSVIEIVVVSELGLVVHLNGLFCFGSSYYAGSWWGHGGGCPPGPSVPSYHLMALGGDHCPPSVSIP